MEDAKLQVRIDKLLLKKAEAKSKEDGFDSLPSLTRFLLNSYIKGNLIIGSNVHKAMLEEYKAEKEKVDRLVKQGNIKHVDSIDDFIDSLDEDNEEVISYHAPKTISGRYSIDEELDKLKYTVAELQAEYKSLSKAVRIKDNGNSLP